MLRVAIFLKDNYNQKIGGGFTYYQTLINEIDKYHFNEKLEFVFVSTSKKNVYKLRKKTFLLNDSGANISYYILKFILNFNNKIHLFKSFNIILRSSFKKKINDIYVNKLIKLNVDLCYYITPHIVVLDYPYVMTTWDIGHRYLQGLPEVTYNKIFEKRENYFQDIIRKSFRIIVESHAGKNDLIKLFGIVPNKIEVLPLFTSNLINLNLSELEIKENLIKLGLGYNEQYYFYPANFWSHKNHYNLFFAFRLLLDKYPNIKLLLSGSDKGNLDYLKNIICDLKIENNIIFAGFVDEKVIYSLYANAVSLIFPSILGPTNIPILEALEFDCPILCTELDGYKEIDTNLISFFNPYSPEEISKKMEINLLKFTSDKRRIKKRLYNPDLMHLEKIFMRIYPERKMFGINLYQS